MNFDLITLALYDIVIWADDSTSMSALDNGERIRDLEAILGRVADAATLFDTDGISFSLLDQHFLWHIALPCIKLTEMLSHHIGFYTCEVWDEGILQWTNMFCLEKDSAWSIRYYKSDTKVHIMQCFKLPLNAEHSERLILSFQQYRWDNVSQTILIGWLMIAVSSNKLGAHTITL